MFKRLLEHIRETYPEVTDQDFNKIIQVVNLKEYKKKDILWKEGDLPHEVLFVLKGCFRFYSTNQLGQETNTQFAVEDWWLGDIGSLLHDKPAQQSVQALEDAQVLCFEKPDYKNLLENCYSFRKFTNSKRDKSYEAAVNRLASINEPAEVRYANFLKKYPTLLNRISLYHVASYLGITPESLSRIRKSKI